MNGYHQLVLCHVGMAHLCRTRKLSGRKGEQCDRTINSEGRAGGTVGGLGCWRGCGWRLRRRMPHHPTVTATIAPASSSGCHMVASVPHLSCTANCVMPRSPPLLGARPSCWATEATFKLGERGRTCRLQTRAGVVRPFPGALFSRTYAPYAERAAEAQQAEHRTHCLSCTLPAHSKGGWRGGRCRAAVEQAARQA